MFNKPLEVSLSYLGRQKQMEVQSVQSRMEQHSAKSISTA